VRVGGERVKPARTVRVGDEVRLTLHPRVVECRVVRTIEQRVGAPIAVECYEVTTEVRRPDEVPWWDEVGRRDRGAGRPTKRDRRQIDDLQGRPRGN
jgi:ribosome-associated heat shock protein Hsp15